MEGQQSLIDRDFTYNPHQAPLHYIYQDDHILIVNKPEGLLSVPGKGANHADCLETRIRTDYSDSLTIHRLDMATSGVMVFARNPAAQRHIGLQFEKRYIEKTYWASIWGHPVNDSGYVDLPLRCDWPNRPRQMVCYEHGKSAQTHWKVLAREAQTTLIELRPKTGRSHQLRVHMLALGHPIIGDRLYAHDAAFQKASRLYLHAHRLRLRHPVGGEWIEFTSPCPFYAPKADSH